MAQTLFHRSHYFGQSLSEFGQGLVQQLLSGILEVFSQAHIPDWKIMRTYLGVDYFTLNPEAIAPPERLTLLSWAV